MPRCGLRIWFRFFFFTKATLCCGHIPLTSEGDCYSQRVDTESYNVP